MAEHKLKPIIFNTEMVRAILDGRKTVTRRGIKPQPEMILAYCYAGGNRKQSKKWGYPDKNAWEFWGDKYKHNKELSTEEKSKMWTPPYHTDDILYVRETWCQPAKYIYWYKADSKVQNILWRPSIHMPKEAARIFLRVTNVSVAKLQDITCDEIIKEGLEVTGDANDEESIKFAKSVFGINVWNNTIKKSDLDRYGWNANPWVWVIEFERIERS